MVSERKIPRISLAVDVSPPAPSACSQVSSWPRGALEFFVLPEAFGLCGAQHEAAAPAGLWECPSSLPLQAFEVLGQDFLVCGSGAEAAAATALCQVCENPKATAKGFTFHRDKVCRGEKWADLRKHGCEIPVLPCRATRAEFQRRRTPGWVWVRRGRDTVTCWELCLHVNWLCSLFWARNPSPGVTNDVGKVETELWVLGRDRKLL